ncbi:hypothetical protein NPA31_011785 [Aurantimonas sp. MSK8Z-1]|uniref:hypothetical protein n=1 Tax=Mangrovibrevibacter kandeliae TaxID=2968473 RepID=UPI002119B48A|nr:hypothetical protein [Aurantimonas sp. MSK8Z-1]MCW4115644.1 hypothetical protein [Aurantimonas sp. MSK8Z-1]
MAYTRGSYPLLSSGSATGSAVEWAGGPGVVVAQGTFGGATVTLQWSADDGDDEPLPAFGRGDVQSFR